jgi:hypothetical protein
MPIRSIDYRQSKIKSPLKGLRPKSLTLYVDNSFVFSDDVRNWYSSVNKERKNGKGMVKLDV